MRLSDSARHVVAPAGVKTTGWPAVRATCKRIEIEFDDWQEGAGKLILAKRGDGLYAADTVVISIPRQVGKTFLIGAIIFALCIIFPGTTVIWTAHRFKTARETFASLKGLALRPVMLRHVDPDKIYSGAGNESIAFRNGSRIVFGARERGAGRGFSEVDVLVIDEAQILSQDALADMVPTTNQSANPLIFLTGTPPRPVDPGEAFAMLRSEALEGESDDTLYLEFSADPDADPLDRAQWAKANPSYPKRTSARAILRMRKNLTAEDFLREALGVWDEDEREHETELDVEVWSGAKDSEAELVEGARVTIAVAVSTNRRWSTIATCGPAKDGRRLVMVKSGRRTAWIVDKLVELKERHNPLDIALDPSSAAGSLLTDLRDAGLEIHEMTARETAQATGAFIDAVDERRIVHTGQRELDTAVTVARTRLVGEARRWDARGRADVSPVQAVTIAHHRFAELDGDDYDPLDSVLL